MSEHHAPDIVDPARYWEEHYSGQDQVWSGRVNPVLTEVAAELPVGTALDLGCGEGADAVWLAGMGWRVTAVDISATALERTEAAAERAGVASRVTCERHDLVTSFPAGEFALVSAHFLQSPLEFPRPEVLKAACLSVELAGRLLIVDHGAPPPWASEDHAHADFPTVHETYDNLDLIPDRWRVERLEAKRREAVGPSGETGVLLDNIILLRRLA